MELRNDLLPGNSSQAVTFNKSEEKLSAALLELAIPFMAEDMPLAARRMVVGLAALAWNMSVMGESEIQDEEGKAFLKMENTGEALEGITQSLALLRASKELRFPDDRRLIIHWELLESKNEYRVLVAGSLPRTSR
ncbi:MAG: hypothetical protein HGA66_07520 [Holophaga sp.]|nr:hypothetical protein [Holophaga sp.]